MKRLLCAAVFLLLFCTGCGKAPLHRAASVTELPLTEIPSEPPAESFPETVPELIPETDAPAETEATKPPETEATPAKAPAIVLTDADGSGTEYTFVYAGEAFQAFYTPDNWKIINSYRITDAAAMLEICEALNAEHTIHSADYTAWRTPEDMAYEWEQHNLAYQMLADDSPWKESARDVDINPEDQGKSLYELYQSRIQ